MFLGVKYWTNKFQITYYDLLLKQKLDRSHRTNGFYIEAGAGDGEIISNSLYFELKYGVNYRIYTEYISILYQST